MCVYISYQGPATEPIGNDVVDESNVKKNEHNKEVSTKATGEYIMYLSVKKKKNESRNANLCSCVICTDGG